VDFAFLEARRVQPEFPGVGPGRRVSESGPMASRQPQAAQDTQGDGRVLGVVARQRAGPWEGGPVELAVPSQGADVRGGSAVTDGEFREFSRKLFSAFPGLWEWINANSPDPLETQAVWRKCLAPYSVEECQSVLDRWSMGELPAPQAYERDRVHVHIRATIDRDRSLSRKAEAKQADGDYWRDESERRRMRRRGEDVQGGI